MAEIKQLEKLTNKEEKIFLSSKKKNVDFRTVAYIITIRRILAAEN